MAATVFSNKMTTYWVATGAYFWSPMAILGAQVVLLASR
jgi:hypothetical protein